MYEVIFPESLMTARAIPPPCHSHFPPESGKRVTVYSSKSIFLFIFLDSINLSVRVSLWDIDLIYRIPFLLDKYQCYFRCSLTISYFNYTIKILIIVFSSTNTRESFLSLTNQQIILYPGEYRIPLCFTFY